MIYRPYQKLKPAFTPPKNKTRLRKLEQWAIRNSAQAADEAINPNVEQAHRDFVRQTAMEAYLREEKPPAHVTQSIRNVLYNTHPDLPCGPPPDELFTGVKITPATSLGETQQSAGGDAAGSHVV